MPNNKISNFFPKTPIKKRKINDFEETDEDGVTLTLVETPKKETTKTHKAEKERLQNIYKNQTVESPRITYSAVTKKLIEGESFEQLYLDDDKTNYLKCLPDSLIGTKKKKIMKCNYH